MEPNEKWSDRVTITIDQNLSANPARSFVIYLGLVVSVTRPESPLGYHTFSHHHQQQQQQRKLQPPLLI
jgi:hypothetical protein